MKKNDIVSIVVPAYNCENTIIKCLDSINRQDYELIDVIVINDGSNDSTEMLLKKYYDNPKFKIISKCNEGVSITRNLGIKVAKGDYVIFIDADDYIEKNFVSSLIKLQRLNESSLCGCFIKRCSQNGKLTMIKHENEYEKKYFVQSLIDGDIDGFIVRYLFKKEMLRNVCFDKKLTYMEDTMFLLKYVSDSRIKDVVFTSDTNYIYLYQSSNSVTNNEKFVEKNIINMCKSLNQIYSYANTFFEVKDKEILIKRKARMMEYCFSKIKSRKVYLEVKNNNDIKKIYKDCINSEYLNIMRKALLILLFNLPYFGFKMYIFIRNTIKKLR